MFSFGLWMGQAGIIDVEAVLKSSYNGHNPTHVKLLMARSKAFQASLEKLQHIDHILMAGGGAELLLWGTGIIGGGVGLMLTAGLVYYALQYEDRRKHAREFRVALNDLCAIYQWCAREQPTITQDKYFILLLNQLAPYVATKELLPWDLSTVSADALSPAYMSILAKSPHRLQFVGVHQSGQSQSDTSLLKAAYDLFTQEIGSSVTNRFTAPVTTYMENNQYFRLFSQSLSELKLAVYGKDSSGQNVTEKSSKFYRF